MTNAGTTAAAALGRAVPGRYRVRVQIGRERFRELKAGLLDIACRRCTEELGWEFWNLPWEPYAPIRRQWLNILRLVNEQRQKAGQEKLAPSILRYRRKIVKPFELMVGSICEPTA